MCHKQQIHYDAMMMMIMMMCIKAHTMRIFMCVNYGVISMQRHHLPCLWVVDTLRGDSKEFHNYTPLDFLAI